MHDIELLDQPRITMGSLFDGIGGFPLAAVHCGIVPVWASGTGFVKGAFCKSYRLFNKYIYKPFRAVLKIENCSKKHFNQYIYFLQC